MDPELGHAGVWSQEEMKWQQQQQQQHQRQSFVNENECQDMFTLGFIDKSSSLNVVKPDPGLDECWAGIDISTYGDRFGYGFMHHHMFDLHGNNSSSVLVSSKKRKIDMCQTQTQQVVSEKEKKIKGYCDQDSKISRQNSNSNSNSKNESKEGSTDKSKVSEAKKPDYIHVRARRGQATDSHSLAERVRREKISKRMKYLQDLVPGCNKITGKAGMLDEIINYVQSLQKQVEFLSMKLANVDPELDFNVNNAFTKEMFECSTSEFPALGCSSASSACFDQLNSIDQLISYHGLDMGMNSTEMGLRRSISAPVPIQETFMDSSCFSQIQPTTTWDADTQNLYRMEFEQQALIPFQFPPLTGSNEASNPKMET
ncbi:hypothetical protein QVD17_30194 [Tagetes erecta]|uniref:BHLH domain-containing protein n=1 Tax=Tagetes erecta TaxID=13708 RepID=A0AAD8NFT8_TARER|nr:hypothetical protein QVD17_30194 [Tagetes erecta]